MKLVNESKGVWQYLLNQNEADVLRGLAKKFPFTEDVHIHISKTDRDPKADEREKLLNESLAEHRKELKKLAVDILAGEKWKQSEKGCILTLKSESREILLQILNDIRIGCWRKLGEPEAVELRTRPQSNQAQAYRNLMGLAGYFEQKLLELDKLSL
jgi:hypothetical protein